MTNQRLRSLLEHHLAKSGMSQTTLAKNLRVAPSAISRILSGERQISAPELFAIRETFKIPMKVFQDIFEVDFRDEEELIAASYYHESLNVVGGKLIVHLFREKSIIVCPDLILNRVPGGYSEQIRWVEIADDTMSPTLVVGDIALIDTRDIGVSGIYLLKFTNERFSPRRIDAGRWDGEDLLITVSPENPKYQSFTAPLTDLRIAGRVAGKMTTYL